jgi:hypothetical protein
VDVNGEFSFNKTVGARTEKNGYKVSKIIVGGEFVDGVGGGVCQVSTTLYNAVLLAGLNITECHPHSLPVSYVAPSFDAMVNSGSSDLRFINNTYNPIIIKAFADGTTLKIEIWGEPLLVNYSRQSVVTGEIPAPKEQEVLDEKGEYHNSPMVSPVTILSRLEFNKIDNDFYKSMIQHWNEIKDLFESEENHHSFYCNWCGSTFPGKLKDDGTMPNCPTCYENRYKDDPDKDKDGHANKDVHADIAGETADKIHEEFRNAKDRQRETLEKICEKYNTGVQDYLYVDGYGDFDDLIEDLQACDKLNESYAVVEYWGNDWKSKEKVINGKTTKEVEKKVLKLADKNEVIATRQASADLKTSEVLCDMGDGVQRWDYNNNKFEEMDESEKKKYWTYY